MAFKILSLVAIFALGVNSFITINRTDWGARPPKSVTPMANPVPYTIIHHDVTGKCSNQSDCSAIVRSIQDYHMDTNGWDDIGYNFLVGGDGVVYEGRGWSTQGEHAPGYDSQSLGICFIGDFTSISPPSIQLGTTQAFLDFCMVRGYITSDYKLYGHRQVTSTSCPGDVLYDIITRWGHWSPNVEV